MSLFLPLRSLAGITALLSTLSFPLNLIASETSTPVRPPNFVVILADDLGAKELGCYGHPTHKTPNLDRLAKEGMRFETCYSTPLCTPTRVELMTGRYGFRTGWYNLIDRPYTPEKGTPEYDLGAREITFADVLKKRGYATGLAGKWQLPGEHPTLIRDCGFDEYCMWAYTFNLPPGSNYKGKVRGIATSRYWQPSIVKNGEFFPTKPNDYGPDIHNEFILDFITKNRERPFVAYLPALQTHSPFEETPDPNNKSGKLPKGFESNLVYLDHLVGELVKGLEKSGVRDKTVVIFMGDNGTQGSGKSEVTELGARVPLIVNCPGIVKAGVVSEELVDLSDIFPTMAELAGAEMPTDRVIDGKSFAGVLRGDGKGPREWIFSYLRDQHMLRSKRWLREGDGKFYDCGDSRDGTGYKDVTNSTDPEVVAARNKFEAILKEMPAPATLPETERRARRSAGNNDVATTGSPD